MNIVQYRMARGGLNYSTRQVATAANVSIVDINALHLANPKDIDPALMTNIRDAFVQAGVVFLGDDGLRLQDLVKAQQTRAPGPATDALKTMDEAIEEHEQSIAVEDLNSSNDK